MWRTDTRTHTLTHAHTHARTHARTKGGRFIISRPGPTGRREIKRRHSPTVNTHCVNCYWILMPSMKGLLVIVATLYTALTWRLPRRRRHLQEGRCFCSGLRITFTLSQITDLSILWPVCFTAVLGISVNTGNRQLWYIHHSRWTMSWYVTWEKKSHF